MKTQYMSLDTNELKISKLNLFDLVNPRKMSSILNLDICLS